MLIIREFSRLVQCIGNFRQANIIRNYVGTGIFITFGSPSYVTCRPRSDTRELLEVFSCALLDERFLVQGSVFEGERRRQSMVHDVNNEEDQQNIPEYQD